MAIEDPKWVTDNDMIVRGDVQIDGTLTWAGTTLTVTAAELNSLDGITASVAELNILDTATVTAAELNALAAQSGGLAYETQAAVGADQAGAVAITADFALVTGADGAVGARLPVPVAGRQMIVKNGANAVLKVYPNVGGAINAIAANGALEMAALTSAVFVASSATQWWTVPLLPS